MQIPVLTNDTARTKYTIDNSNIATVNSNGFIQAKEFKQAAGLTGIILT